MMQARVTRAALGAVLPILLVLAWDHGSRQGLGGAYAFVPLDEIGASFTQLLAGGELFSNLAASFRTASTGLIFGGTAGIALGSLMAQFATANRLIGPLFHGFRQVPTLGLIPLVALWFGSGELSIKLLVAIAVFEVMTLNTLEGLRGIEARYLELGRALMFTKAQCFFRIMLPAAFPSILTGLLQAVSFAWMATVGAELLFTVGPGLGVIMERAQLQARMDVVIVCLIFIGALGFAMNAACVALGRRVLRWRENG